MSILRGRWQAAAIILALGSAFSPTGPTANAQALKAQANRPSSAPRPKPPATDPRHQGTPVAPAPTQPTPPVRLDPSVREAQATGVPATSGPTISSNPPTDWLKNLQGVPLFAAVSLAPAAVLMVTAFIRINIVLVLLRQALGSPQIPGNQVLAALALLLTALVMRPVATDVYDHAIAPFAEHRLDATQAWNAGSAPIKDFMIRQIVRTGHQDYLAELHELTTPPAPGRVEPEFLDEYPLIIIAPAFLLSELTTALWIGFAVYLPFLVVDLVVSAVLAAMGLFMLPPSMVSMPLKLILFVLADGWMLVAGMLLRGFA